MKTNLTKRVLSLVLTLGMLLSLLSATAFAAEEVTPTPSQDSDTTLNVEYMKSTLYSWDEAAANAATAAADYKSNGYASGTPTIAQIKSGSYFLDSDLIQKVEVAEKSNVSYTSQSVTYSTVCPSWINTNTLTEYYYTPDNGTNYYPVYYTKWNNYTLFYESNGTYTQFRQVNLSSSNKKVTLYTKSESTSYYLTYNGKAVEEGTYYYSTSSTVDTTLYYASPGGSYEGKGFYFTAGVSINGINNDSIADFSKWQDSNQNWKIYSGLAASKLSESSNAPFSDDVNAAKLFATDGSNTAYTSVYTEVKVPYVYNEDTGYYELNSDKNAVYFENGIGKDGSKEEVKMLIADLPAGYVGFSGSPNTSVTGFAPFNSLSDTTMTGYMAGSSSTTTAYQINTASNSNYDNGMKYGFGMVTNVTFQMTDDGKDVNGNDITFEFAGDDDVWVYIDGVLVLDIGGTHDAITGTINFASGDVILHSAEGYSSIGDLADGTVADDSEGLSQTNLYTALGTTLGAFSGSGEHTLTIYYMDRGQGRTNCLIKFNLPQRDSFSVTKSITQSKDPDGNVYPLTAAEQANIDGVDFGFTLYRNGNPVPDKTYYLTYTENGETKQRTASTNANGHFTLKNGQTARFLGEISTEGTSLYVVEDTLNADAYTTPEYSYTTSISSDKVTVVEAADGFTSMKLTAKGSDTAADSIAITCTNYLNEALPNPSIQPADDLIVLDYGLPISISTEKLLANDTRRGDSFTLTAITEQGKYGTATLSEDGTTITYILEKRLDGIEELTYIAVAHSDDERVEDASAFGKVKIIPATSVYYEENFGTLVTTKTNNAVFTSVGTSLTGYQETGYVGTTTDSTYGTDAVYLNNLGDSYGTSLKVDTTNGAAQYSYSFTGTGTTIYGRVSNVTGYIRVTVKDSDGKTVDTQYIDTINYVTKTEDDSEQILDTTLYNIPIYQNTALQSGYDTYTVTIYVYKSGTLHETNNEFYLDGIRVFQPMGTSTDDNPGYATANSAYSADGEQNVAVVNIREKIVADDLEENANDIFTLTDVDGEIMAVEDYADIGPNQELYLKDGYNASFALLNWDAKSYQLYLGMKAPNGEASEVTVGSGTFEIANSADCYYDISAYVESETLDDGTMIGIVNIGGVSGLTALTNLKVTGVDEFNLGYSTDVDGDNEEIETGDNESTNTLYLVSKTFAESLTKEAEEEIPVFTPGSITIGCSYASKTKKATVNVVTSKDVAYVTINGERITAKTVSGKLRFSKAYTKVTKGTTFEIVAYDADGVASATYTVTAE